MSRSKAAIQAAINTQQVKVTAQRAKIEKLSSALKSLQNAEIKVKCCFYITMTFSPPFRFYFCILK